MLYTIKLRWCIGCYSVLFFIWCILSEGKNYMLYKWVSSFEIQKNE